MIKKLSLTIVLSTMLASTTIWSSCIESIYTKGDIEFPTAKSFYGKTLLSFYTTDGEIVGPDSPDLLLFGVCQINTTFPDEVDPSDAFVYGKMVLMIKRGKQIEILASNAGTILADEDVRHCQKVQSTERNNIQRELDVLLMPESRVSYKFDGTSFIKSTLRNRVNYSLKDVGSAILVKAYTENYSQQKIAALVCGFVK